MGGGILMSTNIDILNKGMECLTNTLGMVEAERFITLIHLEKFDYTQWRKENLFKEQSIDEISSAAMEYRNSKNHK